MSDLLGPARAVDQVLREHGHQVPPQVTVKAASAALCYSAELMSASVTVEGMMWRSSFGEAPRYARDRLRYGLLTEILDKGLLPVTLPAERFRYVAWGPGEQEWPIEPPSGVPLRHVEITLEVAVRPPLDAYIARPAAPGRLRLAEFVTDHEDGAGARLLHRHQACDWDHGIDGLSPLEVIDVASDHLAVCNGSPRPRPSAAPDDSPAARLLRKTWGPAIEAQLGNSLVFTDKAPPTVGEFQDVRELPHARTDPTQEEE
jgi:hypothetical protein